jgi:hypothetical protein
MPTIERAWNAEAAPAHLPEYARTNMPSGARLVVTDELRLLVAFARTAVERGHVIVVSGESGIGKTTMAGAVEAVATVRVARAEIPPRSRDKQVWEYLARAVLGSVPGGTAAQLRDAITARLIAEPTLLFVDDAHNVGLPCLLQLRWLHSATNRGFGLVLLGVHLDAYLNREAQLRSRVTRRVLLRTPDFGALREQLAAFHPVLAHTSPALLGWVNDVYAHDSWYPWASFTAAAVEDLRVTTHLTPATAALAVRMTSGIAHAVPADVLDADEQHHLTGRVRHAS